jgi:Domain of unknown function (DUF4112)
VTEERFQPCLAKSGRDKGGATAESASNGVTSRSSMYPKAAEPEIIPPRHAAKGELRALDDETLAMLASLLDDVFRIPGTGIRFGLDPLIGLIPGIGDLLSGMASFLIILAAWQRQLSRATIARMVANVAIDTVFGVIPVAGDAFDAAWKSNRKNFTLLQRASREDWRRQRWHDWLFLAGVGVVLLVLISVPIVVLYLLVHALGR